MAQLEAARAQQAAEAACIGLTLDEEKITSLSASTRRHLQGLALVVQVGVVLQAQDHSHHSSCACRLLNVSLQYGQKPGVHNKL